MLASGQVTWEIISLSADTVTHFTLLLSMKFLKGIDMVKSWPGPGQKYNLLYSTASTHPVSLCR